MQRSSTNTETWKKIVLQSMPVPAWLGIDAPQGEIVLSTRVRYARNLYGHAFPHQADFSALRTIQKTILEAVKSSALNLKVYKRISGAERDYLVGCRLLSPEFKNREPGRLLLLDESRSVSVMVNEEDHLRMQALVPGWSLPTAMAIADILVVELGKHLKFAYWEPWGNLTASPHNVGSGKRLSAMLHLIGLAHTQQVQPVLIALQEQGIHARGLFGESSRAVGAFFQVSTIHGSTAEFQGACEYLITKERQARAATPRQKLNEKASEALQFAVRSTFISLADALRVLAWARWASLAGLPGFPPHYREIDKMICTMEVHGTTDALQADRHRANFLRQHLEPKFYSTLA